MQNRALAVLLLVAGLALVALAVLVAFGGLSWFGKLPGDIRIDGDRTRIFIPLTSMLLVSVVLTLLINLVRKIL